MWDLLTVEERAWKATCRRFAEEVIAPEARRYDQANELPRAVHERAYEAGLMNVGFPTSLGGRGMSHRQLVVGGEELAAVCSPTAFTMGFNHGALQPVLYAGSEAQRSRFIGELVERRGYASICLTEAAASGSNLMDLHTRATRTGSGWRLEGTKVMVGNGCDASLFVVLAEAYADGQRQGPTFFVVERGPGVQVGPNTDKIGFRCVTTPQVVFDGVEVDDAHRLGGVGEAEQILLGTLDYIRFGGASVILGIVVGALREAVPWLEERRVYLGEPLIQKSHVQLELAEIFTGVREVRHLLWRAAELLDRGARCSLETSMAKLTASRLAVDATNRIVQLYGWRGIDAEYGIQKRVRDARVTTIYEGTSEVQLLNIFRELSRSLAEGGDLSDPKGSAKRVPYSKHREVVYNLQTRAKRFHATFSTTIDLDVTELVAAVAAARAAGREVGFVASLAKATSLVLKKFPRLNAHLFHGFWGKYVVEFEEVSCQLIVLREAEDGEKILLPLIIERSNERTIEEIQAEIRRVQTTPLAELPQIQAIQRYKRLPRLVMKWFSYKFRSDHRFYRRFFGTFGLSPLLLEVDGMVKESADGALTRAAHAMANTGAAFLPIGLGDQALVIEGQVVPRKVLTLTFAGDHFLVDGQDLFVAGQYLRLLLQRPGRLGL